MEVPAPTGPSRAPAPQPAADERLADDNLPTSEEDKVKAAREIGVEPDNEWLSQTDRNFVFKIWQHSAGYPMVRDAAELVLAADDDTVDDACREFILRGIADAKKADDAKKISDELAARQARELRSAAYAAAGITIDTDGRMLLLSERDAVIEIWRKAAGARVKAAAEAAIQGDSEQQHTFLLTGAKAAAEQDVQDAIKAAEDASAAEQARIAREGSMRAAAAVLGILADSGKLAMTDDNFVRWIWEAVDTDPRRREIRAAAERALRSSDPAVWRAFIDTGINTANRADLDRLLAERQAADRRAAESIKAQAVTDGFDNLVTAATQILATGDPGQIDDFVRLGQRQVASDDANRPSRASWEWHNLNSDKCLGIENGGVANGSRLLQWECNGAADQQWIGMRVYNTDGRYRLISAKDRTKCVSPASGGTSFVIRTCNNEPDQYFTYRKIGDNYVWTVEQSQQVIAVKDASRDNGALAVPAATGNGTDRQWFATTTQLTTGQRLDEARLLHSRRGHTARLQSDGNFVVSKDARAVWKSNTTAGIRLINQPDGNLVLYRADSTAAWSSNTHGNGPSTLRMQKDGNLVLYRNRDNAVLWSSGYWDITVVSRLNGKCIDVPQSSFVDSNQLQMLTCNHTAAQRWMSIGEQLLSRHNKCMDVRGGGRTNGTPIQLYTCNSNGSQKFLLNPHGQLVNPQSGRCVAILNASGSDGAKLILYDCNAGANEAWQKVQDHT